MATVDLIHGFVGVGKTTFAIKLAQEKHILRFSIDEWMIGLFGINPPVDTFRTHQSKFKYLIWQTAEQMLKL